MFRTLSLALPILTALGAAAAPPAGANQGPPCAERTAIVQQLAARYGEQRIAIGLASNGVVMELFVGPAQGWTLLASRADGVSCIMATGEHLQIEELAEFSGPADPA